MQPALQRHLTDSYLACDNYSDTGGASLREQHEGLTGDLSIAMVKRIQNRFGTEVWPWERADFSRLKSVVSQRFSEENELLRPETRI